MVATTIRNSGGPGSPNELSPVTIAVRDKVIEKFQHEPLDQMNESVKKLLSQETDEQKRLGILAARVYILRQRIAMLSSQDPERVVSSSSPSPENTGASAGTAQDAGDEVPREWTRLRILEDCEVNGVRFPKTVIIDVKSEDAQRLIDSGNAELIEEQPQAEAASDQDPAKDAATEPAADEQPAEAAPDAAAGPAAEDNTAAEATPQQEAAEAAPEPVEAEDTPSPEPAEDVTTETVIEAPSAAEVTAALAALSTDQDTPAEPAPATANASDAEDVAAALQALSGGDTDSSAGPDASSDEDDAAAVAAELEAAAAAMSSSPAPAEDANDDGTAKPGGWFEAQQNAEKAAKTGSGDNEAGEEAPDDKS